MDTTEKHLLLGEPRKGFDGFTTVDIGEEADIRFDLNNPLTEIFAENSVDSIGAYHLIEHLRPTLLKELLRSWVEVLKPGGRLIIECPDFDGCVIWYVSKGRTKLAKEWIFGNDSREGQHHYWGYNEVELLDLFIGMKVDAVLAEPLDYHKEEGPCLRIEATKL